MFDQTTGQTVAQQPGTMMPAQTNQPSGNTVGQTIMPGAPTPAMPAAPTPPPAMPAPPQFAQPVVNDDAESLAAPSIGDDGTPMFDNPETSTEAPGVGKDLLDIKKEALKELSPLVGQLNLPPEEKFKTLMMMIQASDDQALVPMAYNTAHEITDENTRAQALLDVINEINYFMQNK